MRGFGEIDLLVGVVIDPQRRLDGAAAIARGERDALKVEQRGREEMKMFRVEPEYFAVVSAETLGPLRTLSGEVLLAVAAKVGGVRLIDNQLVDVP